MAPVTGRWTLKGVGNNGAMTRPPVLGQQSLCVSEIQIVASHGENMEQMQATPVSWSFRHNSNSSFRVPFLSSSGRVRAFSHGLLSREITSHQAKDLINPVICKSNLLMIVILFLSFISFLFPHPPPNPWLKAPSLVDAEGNASLFFPSFCLPQNAPN